MSGLLSRAKQKRRPSRSGRSTTCRFGTNAVKSVVPPDLGCLLQCQPALQQKLPDEASGRKPASLVRYRPEGRYLSPITGATVLDTGACARSPHSSAVHSALSSRAGLSPSACSLNRRSARTRPRHSLFDVGRYYSPPDALVKPGSGRGQEGALRCMLVSTPGMGYYGGRLAGCCKPIAFAARANFGQ